MAPLVKGDKCDPTIKIQMLENSLSLLQPLKNDSYKTLVSTYTSEFPHRPVNTSRSRPFVCQPATEINKDASHFGKLITETRHKYSEKLPFLEPTERSDRVRQTCIQMHSDKRIGTNYQTSHKAEFPAQTWIPKREKCVPSSETGDRVLPRDRTRVTLLSEQQDKFKCLVGEKEENAPVKCNQTYQPSTTIQGDHCNRYQTTNMDTFQGKWGPSATTVSKKSFSLVLNPDPKYKRGQSIYNDEFKAFPAADRDKRTSDLIKKCSLRPWSDTCCYKTSSTEDYTPKIAKVEICKPLLPRTHSDVPLGDRNPRREADRQQYNTYRHFYAKPPSSGLVRTHVSGANLRTKSNVEFAESADWDRSTTNSNMFKHVPITNIPQRHRSQPPGVIPLDYYTDIIESSTTHSDFQQKIPLPKPAQDTQLKCKAFRVDGTFRDETTQKMDFQPHHVSPRPRIGGYRRQFSSVPLGTLTITI